MLFNSCLTKLWCAFVLLVLHCMTAVFPLAKEEFFLFCVN